MIHGYIGKLIGWSLIRHTSLRKTTLVHLLTGTVAINLASMYTWPLLTRTSFCTLFLLLYANSAFGPANNSLLEIC